MLNYPVTVANRNGTPAKGATVQVRDHYSLANLTLYEADETTTQTNPITIGESGQAEFKIPNSIVDLIIANGYDTQTVLGIKISDGAELAQMTNGSGGSIAYGVVCYLDTDGTIKVATNAGTEQQAKARWICVTRGGVANGAIGVFSGPGLVSGLSGGSAGMSAWLSGSGSIGNSAGSGEYRTYLGEWHSATVLNFTPGEAEEITVVPVASLDAIRTGGAIYDFWMDRANFKLYIIGGTNSVNGWTDAGGSKTRYYAACIDLETGLLTDWAPNLSSASAYIYGDDDWIYIYGVTVNSGSTNYGARVNKTTGASDSGWETAASASTFVVVSGGYVWSGGYWNGSQYTARLLDSAGAITSTDLHTSAQSVTGFCRPCVAASDGTIIASAPASVSPGPPYHASGICRANRATGVLIPATYGPAASHAFATKGSAGGKIVVVGTFTAVRDMDLSNVQTGLNGHAILSETLSAYYAMSVTFTEVDATRTGAIDPENGAAYLGGYLYNIGGTTARRSTFRVNSDGTLNADFYPDWGAVADVRGMVVVGGAVIVMGSWTATINGLSRDHFVALDKETGDIYAP